MKIKQQGRISTDEIIGGVAVWAAEMAEAHRMTSCAYEDLAMRWSSSGWSPVGDLAPAERKPRQALLLRAVQLAADEDDMVPNRRWLMLAEHFGYDSRGTAGFFRRQPDGSPGLLFMDDTTRSVRILSAGVARIREYSEYVEDNARALRLAVAAASLPGRTQEPPLASIQLLGARQSRK